MRRMKDEAYRAQAGAQSDAKGMEGKSCEVSGNPGELPQDRPDSPHYDLWPGLEAIDVIRAVLTDEEFAGFCKGNELKYRLRAGKKGDAAKDLEKAAVYNRWLRQAQKSPGA